MSDFKTPGVYLEEVSKLPPSVAQVETAIPVFIGYTQKQPVGATPFVKRITSLLEYETYFGAAREEAITLEDTANGLKLVKPSVNFLMYYSLQLFFANGGGPCYIISVGNYQANTVALSALQAGLLKAADLDEVTLTVFPDAKALSEDQFHNIFQDALNQAASLKDRFVIMDTYKGESLTTTLVGSDQLNTIAYFRNKISPSKYGAAYFPHLRTSLNYAFDEKVTKIAHKGLQPAGGSGLFFTAENAALVALKNQVSTILDVQDSTNETEEQADQLADLLSQAIAIIEGVNETADTQIDLTDAYDVLNAINDGHITNFDPLPGNGPNFIDEFTDLITALQTAEDKKGAADNVTLESLKTTNSSLYNQIKKEIAALEVVLPPSSAVAGIYAKTDSQVGVWKAPANVGLTYVKGPTEKISDEEQKGLNVDAVAGKSINAIRTFAGKGTLIWGARTLFGNDNEWRYVNVRRLFIMVETSVGHASNTFLFEPNDVHTWTKVQAMIENYLFNLWKDGALAGTTPEQAFYVRVGRETTSSNEILEGIMNVEVGMAAVRPAEFIVLRFSHKLQEA